MRSLSSDNIQALGPTEGSLGDVKRIRAVAFLFGALLGAASFLLIYGVRILNPAYDDWLLLGDMDLKQHYIGFCHFRLSRWQFPIGLIETLSYPESMSVIYTDSIPVLAVLFKLFAYFLPLRFQYFGIAGLCSFMLMGGLSALLLNRFIKSLLVCATGSLFFTVSFPVIQRMYYHTALAAQWIIILSLILWLYWQEFSVKRRVVYWSLMGALCVSIHSYFLPMAGLILLAAIADELISSGRKAIISGLCELSGFCLFALIALFVYGGFYGGTSAVGDGLGTFSSNLNTFLNPLDDGKLYGRLPLYYDFQYEGFGYLGGGVLLLLMLFFVSLAIMALLGRIDLKKTLKEHHRIWIALFLFCVFLALAVFPIVSLNKVKLFGVPYPDFIRSFLGIFRSNGRFIWTCTYLLTLLAIAGVSRLLSFNEKAALCASVLVFAALCLQLYDISGMLKGKHDYFAAGQTYESPWIKEAPVPDIGAYSGFVFLYNENDIIMDTAYFAYLNGMWQNNYYYARDINKAIDSNIEQWKEALRSGMKRPDIIFILKDEDALEDFGLKTVRAFDHVIGTAE